MARACRQKNAIFGFSAENLCGPCKEFLFSSFWFAHTPKWKIEFSWDSRRLRQRKVPTFCGRYIPVFLRWQIASFIKLSHFHVCKNTPIFPTGLLRTLAVFLWRFTCVHLPFSLTYLLTIFTFFQVDAFIDRVCDNFALKEMFGGRNVPS